VRGKTLEGRSPGELRAPVGLNSRLIVADSRVEQDPVGEEARPGVSDLGSDFFWLLELLGRGAKRCVIQRHEGRGVGDGVRLHERSNALKG
jgi:hypothetical protein